MAAAKGRHFSPIIKRVDFVRSPAHFQRRGATNRETRPGQLGTCSDGRPLIAARLAVNLGATRQPPAPTGQQQGDTSELQRLTSLASQTLA